MTKVHLEEGTDEDEDCVVIAEESPATLTQSGTQVGMNNRMSADCDNPENGLSSEEMFASRDMWTLKYAYVVQ